MIDVHQALLELTGPEIGMTQTEVANYVHVSQSRISQLLRQKAGQGMSYESTLRLERLCLLKGINPTKQKAPSVA